MEAVLLLVISVAIGWLVLWCCVDRSKSKAWWPFDYRTTNTPAPTEPQAGRRRQTPTRPWQRSGS
ncbi:MAG TPA: hypothetical protein VFL55_00545 [Acetobacteraceae bacterium]|nr:hypothetical protein [Acetobacteraceae bacterium]